MTKANPNRCRFKGCALEFLKPFDDHLPVIVITHDDIMYYIRSWSHYLPDVDILSKDFIKYLKLYLDLWESISLRDYVAQWKGLNGL